MSTQAQPEPTSACWIVVNECTNLIVSKPCPYEIAEKIREWIEHANRHGYTYTLAPVLAEWDETLKFWPAPDQLFVVENGLTQSTVYEPCTIDDACYLRYWMTRLNPNGHTYTIREITNGFVGLSMDFDREWLGWAQQAYRLRTGRDLDVDQHHDTLLDLWMDGTLPQAAIRTL